MGTETTEKPYILTDKDLIKVLLVEDNATDRLLTERVLAKSLWPVKFVVQCVESLAAAVEHLSKEYYDLILLDLILPDSRGVETVQQIHEIDPHTPIIVLTGLEDEEVALSAVESGAMDYMIKGWSSDNVLVRTILYALARRKDSENWRRTFDAISDFIFIQDEDFTIVRANKAFVDLLGVKPEDIIGKKCYEVFHKSDKPWSTCPLDRTREDKTAHMQEVNDPNVGIPLLVTTSPVLGDKGEFIGSVHIAKDISKRKEAENLILDKNRQLQDTSQKLSYAKKNLEKKNEALEKARSQLESRVAERTSELSQANELLQKEITKRKHIADALQASEANLRKIILKNPDGIIVVDREGAVCFVNPATESLFGRKREELIGETFGFPMVSGEASDVEVVHKTEGTIIAEMRVVEIDWEGQPALLASLHDITKRKKAEEKVKEAMDIKSEFISTASHELRTPLTAMKEAIRLVITEQTGKLNDEQKEFLDIARRNVDRLARLVNDILDFQKLEAGKMEFEIRENDINEVATEVYAAMTPAAKNVGLDFLLELEDDIPRVKFDHDKITQVLTNLVANALKFTERGNITITTSKGENVIQVSVSDTGPGIRAEDLPKVFREFEQLQKGGDRKVGGTGLGLAISKEIIELHRGKICVESEYGKGTVFHFILPIWERRKTWRRES